LHLEIHLDEDAVLVPGDRFVLRRPAPVDTVGGGVVVDAHPPRPRQASGAAFAEEAVELEPAILLRLDRAGAAGREIGDLAAELGATREQLEPHLAQLERAGDTVRSGARVFAGVSWRELAGTVLDALAAFHRDEHLSSGPSREDLRSRLCRTMPQDAWRQLLDELIAAGDVRSAGDKVALAGHEVVLGEPEARLAERLERGLLEAGLEPPDLDELVEPAERDVARRVVEVLIARGALVRIRDGKLFHARALEELMRRLERQAASSRTIDVAAFKALAGVTRKHAIPLLEHLDERRVTRRVGNLREILIPAGQGGRSGASD
jgi:selenocysteine-specific elongation factor